MTAREIRDFREARQRLETRTPLADWTQSKPPGGVRSWEDYEALSIY